MYFAKSQLFQFKFINERIYKPYGIIGRYLVFECGKVSLMTAAALYELHR